MDMKLDENLGESIAAILRAAGHDVATVASQGLTGSADEPLLRICTEEKRALVTLDMDFSNPIRYPPNESWGIAVLRLPTPMSLADLHEVARTLVIGLEQNDLTGKLWTVQPGRLREYQPKRD